MAAISLANNANTSLAAIYPDLDRKRALITGAGRGIGRACAETLAAQGVHVVLTARSEDQIAGVAANIADNGGSAETLAFDAGDVETTQRLIADQAPFDILVNNAGTNEPVVFGEVSIESYDRIMGINVRGAFFVAQAVVNAMVAAGKRGSIINMSSQMGHVGGEKRTVYCTSKHAIEGLTKAMAADLSSSGIRVNSVCPTFVITPMTEPFFEDADFAAKVHEKILLGRAGTMQEVANAVTFLASDASSLMTGSALMVDGGWTAV